MMVAICTIVIMLQHCPILVPALVSSLQQLCGLVEPADTCRVLRDDGRREPEAGCFCGGRGWHLGMRALVD
jgi:hypothetical protein